MRRLMTFVIGMITGGFLLYMAEHYHLVHASDGLHMIPKLESKLAATYVDIREFSAEDWAKHADVAMAITHANQGELLQNSTSRNLQEGVDNLLDKIIPNK